MLLNFIGPAASKSIGSQRPSAGDSATLVLAFELAQPGFLSPRN
jgi:hypothetical protein